ncbi:MAG: glutamate synthase large subunit [Phycisphaerae bacterium]|nr:glutamate synthase large subunit [Phycisphaerae bacterium]
MQNLPPKSNGLYEPRREHDACGFGAVVNISGKAQHSILEMGNQVLMKLQHRGAASADEATGDGAGMLFQIPHDFFHEELKKQNITLPEPLSYGVAMVFEPHDKAMAIHCRDIMDQAISHYGLKTLGRRDVPSDNTCLGELAKACEPVTTQVFIDGCGLKDIGLERKLFLARKRTEKILNERFGDNAKDFYISTMSCKTICYKGMFLAPQLFGYYPDLSDQRVKSSLCLVHQRYSTNTFPSWALAQPFRLVAHNGEINTLSGNINWMRSQEHLMESDILGDLSDVFPVLAPRGSDSACFDNALELLHMAGRSLPHSMMMMIPEAFGAQYHISTDKRAFYEYQASTMEPWDGPAAMVFTDGKMVAGTLDRNGLRPARYVVTKDGLVVLASEVGVIEFPAENIQQKGRLQPGKMFMVDTVEGRIVLDNEIKSKIARQKPYRRWLEQNRIELRGLFNVSEPVKRDHQSIIQTLRSFGYTYEELRMILKPMAVNGQEPIGAMGTDTPLAVLSDQPKLLFSYFKQLFAQVTNPPIDPLREGLVMSLMSCIGRQQNLLTETPLHCKQLKIPHPILTNQDIQRLKSNQNKDFKVGTVAGLFDSNTDNPQAALEQGLQDLIVAVENEIITNDVSMIIVSDRDVCKDRAPIPTLLAMAAIHHHLLDKNLRQKTAVVIESGEPREVMHMCLLSGYGVSGINPYLAFEAIDEMQRRGEIPSHIESEQLIENYIAALKKGILKTMSKMGISTLRSYRGAQLFEAIGLNREFVDKFFTGTTSRVGGIGMKEIAEETLKRHNKAYQRRDPGAMAMDWGGEYQYRDDGEFHMFNPQSLATFQQSVRSGNFEQFKKYTAMIDDQAKHLCTLRGLFELKKADKPVPLDEVEPAVDIVKRFVTGAMSHGSISKEAHETMAIAMNRLGAMSNTGEGGEDPARYQKRENGDVLNCAIKQIASGRFGVTMEYLSQAKMLQIKMAQGAKPGEGGQLPGHKVTDEIARLRHSTPGVTLISPPPHHDIYSIEDLAQLIYDLKCSNPGVKVSVKLVSEIGVGTVAAGVTKGNADEVLISGHDGGTGASPFSSIKHTGCPWELGLAEAQQTLILNGLRDRVRVQVDGQIKTGRDVIIGALLGAESFGFGTTALVSLGCVMLRKCHTGDCSVGIATQDPELRKCFKGKPEHLMNFMLFIAEDTRRWMAEMGFKKLDDIIGRVDLLNTSTAIKHWKTKGIDFGSIFATPDTSGGKAVKQMRQQADLLGDHLDWEIIEKAKEAIEKKTPVTIKMHVQNINRTIGTILSNKIVTTHGSKGLPEDTLTLELDGSAGQSFGAFLCSGVTIKLTGDANDYVGKGLSGGKIIVKTPAKATYASHENIIVGNTLLYGATTGEVYINGLAGERFCVRNSGATAVVEGVGDHGCEYMTGGTVVVLGKTGRNFAAGMSGGIAYVFDEHQLFDTLCNLDMVDLESVWHKKDIELLHELITNHQKLTGSKRSNYILENWSEMMGRFVKVMPIEYRKSLQRLQESDQKLTEFTPATEEVYKND